MRFYLLFVFLVFLITGCDLLESDLKLNVPSKRPQGKLNVVFVLSDALRAENLPLYDYDRKTSPHLDKWKDQGIVFENHFANSSLTPVSVSQIFSSRLSGPILMDARFRLPPVRAVEDDLLILPRLFKELGYKTGIVSAHPWFNSYARVMEFFDVQNIVKPLMRVSSGGAAEPLESYASYRRLWRPVRDFICDAAREKEPFFLYVHSMDTHLPNRCHTRFRRYCRDRDWYRAYNNYDSEIEYTDHWVNIIVRLLSLTGLDERTILVFTADHGEEFNEMGKGPTDRGHGYTARRALVHVPMIMALPGNPTPGRKYKEITQHLDMAPTLARLAVPGVDLAKFRIEGRDLSRDLLGEKQAKRLSFAISTGPRYWGMHVADQEAYYDQWTNETTVNEIKWNQYNYPRPSPVKGKGALSLVAGRLKEEYERHTRDYQSSKPSGDLLADMPIGVPTTYRGPARYAPTFKDGDTDGRWFMIPWNLLLCSPKEKPRPVTLSVSWTPGEYRVWVRLQQKETEKRKLKNGFTIKFGDDEDGKLTFPENDQPKVFELDAGIRTIGDRFEVTISDPEGGVAISGFRLERKGAEADGAKLDDELERKLKSLGYIH